MGQLPGNRIESHGSNSPIKPTTIDGIQDAIIGAKFSNQFPRQQQVWGAVLNGTWVWNTVTTLYVVSSGGAAGLLVPLYATKGETLRSVKLKVYGDGAVDTTYTLTKVDGSGQTVTTLCTGTDTNRSAAWATLDISSLGAFTVNTLGDLEAWNLQISSNAANARFGNIQWVTDRL